MRRQAGEWLREKLADRNLHVSRGVGACIAACVGVTAGILLRHWVSIESTAVWLALSAVLCAGLAWIAWLLHRLSGDGWSRRNMIKGLDAESYVGQVIEYAISAPGCAVAHNVMDIAKAGDIDHLVVTPARIRVVETKSGRVPPREFPDVLRRIAVNVAAVRGWALPATVVQGCLVIAGGDGPEAKRSYSEGAETILVEDPASLLKKLQSEARGAGPIPSELVWRVWKLGKVAEG